MSANGNGSRILGLRGELDPGRNAKDSEGRVLRHNATVMEAHQIAIEEGNKMHAFYMNQLPAFVAHMIQDALVGYGLIPEPLPPMTPCRCGHVGPPEVLPLGEKFFVRCPNCFENERGAHSTKNEAIAAWNAAVALPRPANGEAASANPTAAQDAP